MKKWIAIIAAGIAALAITGCDRTDKSTPAASSPAVPQESPAGEPSTNQHGLPPAHSGEHAPAPLVNGQPAPQQP